MSCLFQPQTEHQNILKTRGSIFMSGMLNRNLVEIYRNNANEIVWFELKRSDFDHAVFCSAGKRERMYIVGITPRGSGVIAPGIHNPRLRVVRIHFFSYSRNHGIGSPTKDCVTCLSFSRCMLWCYLMLTHDHFLSNDDTSHHTFRRYVFWATKSIIK